VRETGVVEAGFDDISLIKVGCIALMMDLSPLAEKRLLLLRLLA